MLPMIKTITIFALLFVQVSTQITQRINLNSSDLQSLRSFSKHLLHSGQDFVVSYAIGKNVTLAHALCDKFNAWYERKCVLTLKTRTSDEIYRSKTCETYLLSKMDNGTLSRKFALTQFGHSSIVLVWKEGQVYAKIKDKQLEEKEYLKQHLKVRILHMNSCEFDETNITTAVEKDIQLDDEYRITNLRIVVYDDGLKLFFRNEPLCDWHSKCHISYDFKTQKFSDRYVRGLPPDYSISKSLLNHSSGSQSSADKAYVTHTSFSPFAEIQLVDALGEISRGHLYPWPKSNVPKVNWTPAMLSYQRRMSLSMQRAPGKAVLLKRRNMPDNGTLVLMGYAPENTTGKLDRLEHVRFDSTGKTVYRYILKDFVCPVNGSSVDVDFYETSGFRDCYNIACSLLKTENEGREIEFNEYRLSFRRYCVPDNMVSDGERLC